MKSGLLLINAWFSIIIILVLISGAVAITFTDMLSDRLYGNKRVFFVIMLLAYAVYRGFRTYHLFKQNKRAQD